MVEINSARLLPDKKMMNPWRFKPRGPFISKRTSITVLLWRHEGTKVQP
jgi:hypothetical protein